MAERYKPGPNYICDFSGFKVKTVVKNWDGAMVDPRFRDKRNPQDFVRGVPDRQDLPFTRPEAPDTFVDPLNPVRAEDL